MRTTIQVKMQNLSETGLCIDYTMKAKRLHLMASPLQTVDLLMRCNYILNYKFRKDTLIIIKEVTEDRVTLKGIETVFVGKQSVTWEYFVRNFCLDELIAQEICQFHEETEKAERVTA